MSIYSLSNNSVSGSAHDHNRSTAERAGAEPDRDAAAVDRGRGAIRPEIDPAIVARAKIGLFTHAISNWIRRPELADREGLVRTLSAMRRLGTDVRAPGASE